MSSRTLAVLLLCLAFQAYAQKTYTYSDGTVYVSVTDANKKGSFHEKYYSPSSSPSPSVEPVASPSPSFEEYGTTEKRLRTFILKGDVVRAAEELRSQEVFGQARGLTYPPKLAPYLEPSNDRNRDPDVVAFKALAKAALTTCDAERLATVVMMSFTPACMCPIFPSEEEDRLRKELVEDFNDPKAMIEILQADANTNPVDGNRKLLQTGRSPVNSFVCARCWPRRRCRRFHWC